MATVEAERGGEFEAGEAAHREWEAVRGTEDERTAEWRIRTSGPERSVDWWRGWLARSDEWGEGAGRE